MQRLLAPSPPTPYADMTLSELTHSFQQLAAQMELDKNWMVHMTTTADDHAEKLNQINGFTGMLNTDRVEHASQIATLRNEHGEAKNAHEEMKQRFETHIGEVKNELQDNDEIINTRIVESHEREQVLQAKFDAFADDVRAEVSQFKGAQAAAVATPAATASPAARFVETSGRLLNLTAHAER